MAGMLEIITYLLCVYLIFKGVEIFQIAFMSSKEHRSTGMAIGGVMIVAALVAAVVFAYWITSQAESMSNSMRNIPNFGR
jgi:uncharacterized membrane protein